MGESRSDGEGIKKSEKFKRLQNEILVEDWG